MVNKHILTRVRIGDPETCKKDAFQYFPLYVEQNLARGVTAVTLTEALERKLITIDETGGYRSISISRGFFNRSDEDVVIFGGDVFQGGLQDRMIGEDMVLSSGGFWPSKSSVYCVEKSRWDAPKLFNGNLFAPPSIRKMSLLNKFLKKDCDPKYQNKVWDGIRNMLGHADLTSETEQMAELNNLQGLMGLTRKELMDFFKYAKKNGEQAGFVINLGRYVYMDVFGSPEIFDKMYEKLFTSYIVEILLNSGELPEYDREGINLFIQDSIKKSIEQSHPSGSGTFIVSKSNRSIGGMLTASKDALIHESLFYMDKDDGIIQDHYVEHLAELFPTGEVVVKTEEKTLAEKIREKIGV